MCNWANPHIGWNMCLIDQLRKTDFYPPFWLNKQCLDGHVRLLRDAIPKRYTQTSLDFYVKNNLEIILIEK